LGAVYGQQFDTNPVGDWQRSQVQLAALGVLEHVAAQLCRQQGHTPSVFIVETVVLRQLVRGAPGMANLAAVFEGQH